MTIFVAQNLFYFAYFFASFAVFALRSAKIAQKFCEWKPYLKRSTTNGFIIEKIKDFNLIHAIYFSLPCAITWPGSRIYISESKLKTN